MPLLCAVSLYPHFHSPRKNGNTVFMKGSCRLLERGTCPPLGMIQSVLFLGPVCKIFTAKGQYHYLYSLLSVLDLVSCLSEMDRRVKLSSLRIAWALRHFRCACLLRTHRPRSL